MTTLLLLLILCAVVLGLGALVVLMLRASRRTRTIDDRLCWLQDDVAELRERSATVELVETELVAGDARAELLAQRLRERYVVTLQTGETFDGLLVDVDDKTIVMQDTSALGADGRKVPVDGDVILQRATVAYLQRP